MSRLTQGRQLFCNTGPMDCKLHARQCFWDQQLLKCTSSAPCLLVVLMHHLEFGLRAILPSHSTGLPSRHSLRVSALLLGLMNGLLHKGSLPLLCSGVVKALLALKVGKNGLGVRHLLLWLLGREGITIHRQRCRACSSCRIGCC